MVTVCHPPILAEHDWRGVGLGTSPFGHSANPSHTPMELILLVQTGSDTLMSASSFLFKGMTSPGGWTTGIVGYGGLLADYCLHPLSHTRAHHSRLGILPHILLCSTGLSLSFSLETCISFFQYCVSQHHLNCAGSSIVVALLSVHFAVSIGVGLQYRLP